jgi:hypothetical protein
MAGLLKRNRETKVRPTIICEATNDYIECLIDTGANVSVFTLGKKALLEYFPDAVLRDDIILKLSGFGKYEEDADVYEIKKLVIRDSENSHEYIELRNLKVACCKKVHIGSPMILSSGLFDNVNVMLMNKTPKRQVWIEHDSDVYEDESILTKDSELIWNAVKAV